VWRYHCGKADRRGLGSVLVAFGEGALRAKFKGGDALDFDWSPNRGTIDLDFSADMRAGGGRPLLTKPGWRACSLGPSTDLVGYLDIPEH